MPEQPLSKLCRAGPYRDLAVRIGAAGPLCRASLQDEFLVPGRGVAPRASWSPRRPGWATPGWPSPIGTAWPECVRAHVAAKEIGLKLVIGAEVTLVDASPILLWAMNRDGYGRLCRLLTRGRRQAPKGECRLAFADVAEHASGLLVGRVACLRPASLRRTCRGGATSFPIERTRWPSCIAARAMDGDWTSGNRAARAARVPLDRRGRRSLPRRQSAAISRMC